MISRGGKTVRRPALPHEPVDDGVSLEDCSVPATAGDLHEISVPGEVEDRVESLVAHARRVERMQNDGKG
jgi:hypothetical protein